MKTHPMMRCSAVFALLLAGLGFGASWPHVSRPPADESDLRFWLENMVWDHGYNDAEVMEATGLSFNEVMAARQRLNIHPQNKPARPADAPLKIAPYPGGRHPRIGFQEGAVWPQRETKFSAFLPWDPSSYIVVDTPEAIWSNLGLTYLAHSHIPTIWDRQGITLEPLEWSRLSDGSMAMMRKLPNGIEFSTKVIPHKTHISLEMTLTNGTGARLSDLRVQMCAMLKAARGFDAQTNSNKVFAHPYSAVRSDDGNRWIIFAWEPCHRPWGNDKCPCLHSDPKFPDLEPGQTGTLKGRLSFYEGQDLEAEIDRIDATGWRRP